MTCRGRAGLRMIVAAEVWATTSSGGWELFISRHGERALLDASAAERDVSELYVTMPSRRRLEYVRGWPSQARPRHGRFVARSRLLRQ
jgi:hypothetical protein